MSSHDYSLQFFKHPDLMRASRTIFVQNFRERKIADLNSLSTAGGGDDWNAGVASSDNWNGGGDTTVAANSGGEGEAFDAANGGGDDGGDFKCRR